MAILKFTGFDMFPGQANAGNTLPVHGAGVTGTPIAASFPISVSNASHLVGVSGLAAHKIGSGVKQRNGLVCYRPAGTSTYALLTAINGETLGNGAWSRVINFTVKDISAADINTAVSLATIGTGPTVLNGYLLGLNASKAIMVNGSNVSGLTWELNREYSVEIKMWRVGTEPNNYYNLEVRLDGTVIRTLQITTVAFTTPLYVTLGMNSNTNITTARTLIYSDIVVSDGDYLGPSQVLPATVTAVPAAGGWEKEGNADAPTTLNDRDDTTCYTSPVDSGALSVKLGVSEDNAVPVRSAQFFVRSTRDARAGRGMQVKVENASGAVVGGPVLISNTTSFADYRAFTVNSLASVGDVASSTLKISAIVP
jgi:hypothetical protein